MSDTAKLIVEIPKGVVEYIKNNGCLAVGYLDEVAKAIQNSTPLDDVRAEIDEQYDRVHPYNIDVAQGLEMALEILNKYDLERDGEE